MGGAANRGVVPRPHSGPATSQHQTQQHSPQPKPVSNPQLVTTPSLLFIAHLCNVLLSIVGDFAVPVAAANLQKVTAKRGGHFCTYCTLVECNISRWLITHCEI